MEFEQKNRENTENSNSRTRRIHGIRKKNRGKYREFEQKNKENTWNSTEEQGKCREFEQKNNENIGNHNRRTGTIQGIRT